MTLRSTSLIPTWVSLTCRRNSRRDEVLVAPRVEAPQRRVVHRGVGVALAPDDDVGLHGAHDGDEGGEQLGRDVAVGVDEAEIAPPSHAQPGPQRVRPCRRSWRTTPGAPRSRGSPSSVNGLPSVEPSDTVMISKVMPDESSTRTMSSTVVRSRPRGCSTARRSTRRAWVGEHGAVGPALLGSDSGTITSPARTASCVGIRVSRLPDGLGVQDAPGAPGFSATRSGAGSEAPVAAPGRGRSDGVGSSGPRVSGVRMVNF